MILMNIVQANWMTDLQTLKYNRNKLLLLFIFLSQIVTAQSINEEGYRETKFIYNDAFNGFGYSESQENSEILDNCRKCKVFEYINNDQGIIFKANKSEYLIYYSNFYYGFQYYIGTIHDKIPDQCCYRDRKNWGKRIKTKNGIMLGMDSNQVKVIMKGTVLEVIRHNVDSVIYNYFDPTDSFTFPPAHQYFSVNGKDSISEFPLSIVRPKISYVFLFVKGKLASAVYGNVYSPLLVTYSLFPAYEPEKKRIKK